ncbi:MAG: hypothetical protein COV76_04330 [Candidatus Omnitrophica bacterium CG11_big_fil_rev_8_21_14_0_20_64_10]|nr:MAG: hypothetical protein COV76_04330 [Candidatus Omnitrophica bacterium CG11_big_fil_rev_8_21_14_0_20_64_10]
MAARLRSWQIIDGILLSCFFLITPATVIISSIANSARQGVQVEAPGAQAEQKVQAAAQAKQPSRESVEREVHRRLNERPELGVLVALLFAGFLSLIGLSLWNLALGGIRLFEGKPFLPKIGRPRGPAWGGREILRIVIAALLLEQGIVWVQWTVNWRSGVPLDSSGMTLAATLAIDGMIFLAAWRLLNRPAVPAADGNGPRAGRFWPSVRLGMGTYFIFLPMLIIGMILLAAALEWLNHKPEVQPVFEIYFKEERAAILGWLTLLVAVVGPVAEELFFRGLLYGWLRSRIGIFRGLLVSAFFFALLHGQVVAFFPILALGLLLGWVYERSGSLAAPIAVHVFHNSGMLFLAFVIKQLAAGLPIL